ncbi:MAG: tetratricopeptide repeat protein [Pyrinomonadaceae bacterium]
MIKSLNERYLAAVIGLVAFVAFANSLSNQFVYDDNRQILMNPLIQRSELYGKALASDVWAFKGGEAIAASNYYRPTFAAWMIVNWRLFGASPFGWHLSNVLLHAAVCILLFALLLRMGFDKWAAAAIGAIFAVHPVHVENVAWISGSTDLLLGLFLLASLIFACRYAEAAAGTSGDRRRSIMLVLSAASFALAVGSKEVALFSLPLFFLIFYRPGSVGAGSGRIRRAFVGTLPFVFVAIAFLIVRYRALGAMVLPVDDQPAAVPALLSIPAILSLYLRQMLFPLWLGPSLPVRPVDSIGIENFILPLIVSAAAVVLLVRLARGSVGGTPALVFFALTLLPAMNVTSFSTEHLAHDRYLYLPLAGFLAVVVPRLFAWARSRGPEVARAVSVLLVTAGALMVVQTWRMNRVWHNDLALWSYAVTIDPRSSHAWLQLGAAEPRAQASLAAFERSIQIRPSATAAVGRARALLALGRPQEAIDAARSVIDADSRDLNLYSLFQAYEAEAIASSTLGRSDEAAASLRSARVRLPIYRAALTEKLAVILYSQGKKQEALAELEAARDAARVELIPASKQVFLRLGMLYAEMGRIEDARAAFQEFLSTTSDASGPSMAEMRRQAAAMLQR